MFITRVLFFFFQAEDGIRDVAVTGVQTCALPIYLRRPLGIRRRAERVGGGADAVVGAEIGRASCREKSVDLGGRRIIKKKKKQKKKHVPEHTRNNQTKLRRQSKTN